MDKTIKIAMALVASDKASRVLNNAFTNAEAKAKRLEKVSKSMGDMGNKMMLAGGAVTAFFGKTVADARESKIAQDKLILGFKTMGSTAAQAQKMIAFAGDKEYAWGISDESIMDVMGKLSSYKRAMNDQAVTSGVFARATQAAFDLQAKGFGDAMGNINALGKALQNPALGAQSLQRQGTINKEDLPMIKRIQATKGVLAAQKYILDSIEKQVKGTAEATADPMERLKIGVGEVSESIGGKLLPKINKYANLIMNNKKEIFAWIDSHGGLIRKVAMAGTALLGFGAAMKAASFVTSGFSTAFSMAGNVVKGGQFIAGLTGFGAKTLEAGGELSKFQTAGLSTLSAMKKVGKGIGGAFTSMGQALAKAGSFMLANPIYLIIAGIAAAAFLIYKYWEPIKAFFTNLWAKVKVVFSAAWNWIKKMFLNYTPAGLVIKHWSKIAAFFTGVWDKVKNIFLSAWQWIANLGKKFWNAGANIVKSVWDGMKSLAHKPVELIADIAKKIRSFLPFSPAKAGALRDIHRVKLIETVAQSIRAQPILTKMQQVSRTVFNGMNQPVPAYAGGGGGGHTFNFNVNVHLSGTATQKDGDMISARMRSEFDKMMRDHQARKGRVSF